MTVHDSAGRILLDSIVDPNEEALEDPDVFISQWNKQRPSSILDGPNASLSVWPRVGYTVHLKRLDLYQCGHPKAQQATTNREESLRMRRTPNWAFVRAIFFLNEPCDITRELCIETGSGPRRRQRVSLHSPKELSAIWKCCFLIKSL
jgi:hypothetical protein